MLGGLAFRPLFPDAEPDWFELRAATSKSCSFAERNISEPEAGILYKLFGYPVW